MEILMSQAHVLTATTSQLDIELIGVLYIHSVLKGRKFKNRLKNCL